MTDDNIKSDSIDIQSKEVTYKHHNKKKHDNGHVSTLFWGLLFILIGGLTLANNFGFVDIYWSNVWRLWPMIFVAIGLSILSFRHIIWRILSVILVILSIVVIGFVAIGNFPNSSSLTSRDVSIQKTNKDVNQAEISITTGASSLQVNTADQDVVAYAKLESNVSNLSSKSVINGTTQQITFGMDTNFNSRWWVGDANNIWTINLTRNMPLKLNVDSGASDINIDMSQAKLRAISIKTGASSLILKIGNNEIATDVSIESGVSSIKLLVPFESGVQVKLDNGLTSNNLSDLNKIGESLYETVGYSSATKKINVVSKIGLSSFTIDRY